MAACPRRAAAARRVRCDAERKALSSSPPTFLNRCAIILTPKAPYVAWANSLDADGPRFDLTRETEGEPVFLGPDVDTIEEAEAFVVKNFDLFFDHYLEQWCTNETLWSQHRTRKVFKKWFDVRIHSVVEDVVDAPLELE